VGLAHRQGGKTMLDLTTFAGKRRIVA